MVQAVVVANTAIRVAREKCVSTVTTPVFLFSRQCRGQLSAEYGSPWGVLYMTQTGDSAKSSRRSMLRPSGRRIALGSRSCASPQLTRMRHG